VNARQELRSEKGCGDRFCCSVLFVFGYSFPSAFLLLSCLILTGSVWWCVLCAWFVCVHSRYEYVCDFTYPERDGRRGGCSLSVWMPRSQTSFLRSSLLTLNLRSFSIPLLSLPVVQLYPPSLRLHSHIYP